MRIAACMLVLALFAAPEPREPYPAAAASTTAPPPAVSTYQLPLPGAPTVVRPFVAPATRYGPGHRGVDLASRQGETVLAAGSGVVTFAGLVAGRGVIVIAHPDGIRSEYEPVAATVSAGHTVARGDVIGSVHGLHTGCRPGACLHWGARRGDAYFDPLTLLQPLGVVRLSPAAG